MTPQELKASILQLAIQGKLVEQCPEEGTGEDLFLQIQAEKQALIKAGKIKKEKPLPEITEDEIPFDIPESWRWIKLGELVRVIGGVSYKKGDVSKSGIRILRGGNIQSMKVLTDEDDVFLPHEYKDDEKQVRVGDILIVASTGSKTIIGKAGYVDREMPDTMIGAFLRICRPVYSEIIEYLRCLFDSEFYRKHIRDLSQGTNINNVKESYITEFVIPLPPLAEQKRIVAKIEELLPLIDRYEQAWSKLEDFNKRFPVDMQKSILQTAIQGKLVEQRPEEGTGEELFQQIQAEKQELIKAGKIKKEKPLPEITEDELPFDIPENWKWARMGNVYNIHSSRRIHANEYVKEGIPFFRSLEVVSLAKGNEPSISYYISNQRYDELCTNNIMPRKGDLLITCIGGSIGWNWIVDDRIFYYKDGNVVAFDGHINFDIHYLQSYLSSPLFKEQVKRDVSGTAYNALTIEMLKSYLIPVPPLPEQKRIVAKLEELLPLCERLK